MTMWYIIDQILIAVGLVIFLLVLLVGLDFYKLIRVSAHWRPCARLYTKQPTLFIHGYRGNRYSFGHLLGRLQKAGIAKKSMVIWVGRNGRLHVDGDAALQANNPTIQVLFANNRADVQDQVRWLAAIIEHLKEAYGVTQVNLVGHSMGAITVLRYLLTSDHAVVDKVILLAAPVNDPSIGPDTPLVFWSELTSRGPVKRTRNYNYLAVRAKYFPTAISVLNIAGELLGTNRHDGSVAVDSSFALRSLLKGHVRHYQEMLVRGPGGAHSMLHENRLVDQAIDDFLWRD
ncbi:PGAP1-like family protein [Latilactobacillus curvatus CRL 705]|uniref:alpha/beta fold hydrolase n=1 Tax=Latilactobacillus curvatus TaxID=28038 RepID=UPI000230F09E|nr:alpha/beta fold hydrolase [Latilactobacillus curvatus]EHE85487.1 PGAP1-like family protein [Latilactobacillus curvatus CRL 705]